MVSNSAGERSIKDLRRCRQRKDEQDEAHSCELCSQTCFASSKKLICWPTKHIPSTKDSCCVPFAHPFCELDVLKGESMCRCGPYHRRQDNKNPDRFVAQEPFAVTNRPIIRHSGQYTSLGEEDFFLEYLRHTLETRSAYSSNAEQCGVPHARSKLRIRPFCHATDSIVILIRRTTY